MATLTDAPETLAVGSRLVRGRFLAAFAFGLLGILAIAAGAMAAFERAYEGRILPGVRAAGVDLAGLTPDEASGRLLAARADLAEGEVVLDVDGTPISLGYADLGRRLDVDALVAGAMTVGRGGSLVERLAADVRTAIVGVELEASVALDKDAIRAVIAAAAAPLTVPPVDARIVVTEDGYTFTEASSGRVADVDAAARAVAAALADPAAPATVRMTVPVLAMDAAVTTDEARLAVERAGRMSADIVLSGGGATDTIPGDTVRSWLSFTTTPDGTLAPVVDPTGPAPALAAFAPKVALEPVEPEFVVDGTAIVGILPGTDGAALDAAATTGRILQLLAARADGIPITTSWVAVTRVPPKLSDAEAASTAPKMQLISEWTTYFPYGIFNNNGANIWIPARDIDGLVLAPGETFDFWKAIGPVTRERGYGDGGAIINGHTEPQGALAGGICSTSTTLFNAALRAGLEMGARRNHYYYINRYPLGLDATVYKSSSGSTQTMTFRNDTEYPILIRGYGWRRGTKGYVKFELYSVPTGRVVAFSTPTVTDIRKAADSVEYTTELAPGDKYRLELPHDGMKVWVTRTVRDASGAIVHQETYYSRYARITGVLQIGVAPSPDPSPSPSPTPTPEPSPPPDPTPTPSAP